MVQVTGNLELKGQMSGNTYFIDHVGPLKIEFLDTNQTIEYSYPQVQFSGLIYGTQALTIDSSMFLVDKRNQLMTHLSFGELSQKAASNLGQDESCDSAAMDLSTSRHLGPKLSTNS